MLISLDEIRAAHDRIRPHVVRSPLVPMADPTVVLKAESLQPVGSFKLRGAMSSMLSMSADERARGVVAHSSGNHAIAVAHAGAALGVAVTVVMPDDAPATKVARTLELGARMVVVGPSSAERAERAAALVATEGLVLVEPYDSRAVLAATATIAVEVLEDLVPRTSPVIYAPVSGGGLAGGVAAGTKLLDDRARVVAVEPEVAADYLVARRAGARRGLPAEVMARTSADGLRVQQVGVLPWEHLEAYVDDVVTVTEDEIRAAQQRVLEETGLIAEPSGAVSVAAALIAAPLDRSRRHVAILTGANVDPTPGPHVRRFR